MSCWGAHLAPLEASLSGGLCAVRHSQEASCILGDRSRDTEGGRRGASPAVRDGGQVPSPLVRDMWEFRHVNLEPMCALFSIPRGSPEPVSWAVWTWSHTQNGPTLTPFPEDDPLDEANPRQPRAWVPLF